VALDGKCQHELRESFKISEISLPTVAAYMPAKKKGLRLVGTFNMDDVTKFVEGVLRGKQELFNIPKLGFVDKDCKIEEEKENTDEEDEVLKEILQAAEKKTEQKTQKKSDTKRGRRKKPKNKNEDEL
jgi:hypothetical protein